MSRDIIDRHIKREEIDLLEYIAFKLQWWVNHREAGLKVLFYDFGNDLNDWLESIKVYQKDEPVGLELSLCGQEATVLLAVVRELWSDE